MDWHLIIPGLEHCKAEPICERLKNTLLRRDVPTRVPFMELYQDEEIRTAILGRPLCGLEDLAELQLRSGYDTLPFRMSPQLKTARQDADDSAQLARPQRSFVVESQGLIRNREDFEKYPWPEVDQTISSRLDSAQSVLPEGMGITLQTSGVFENLLRLMSYQRLSEALCDDPQLVRKVWDRIENIVRPYLQGMGCEKVLGVFWGDDRTHVAIRDSAQDVPLSLTLGGFGLYDHRFMRVFLNGNEFRVRRAKGRWHEPLIANLGPEFKAHEFVRGAALGGGELRAAVYCRISRGRTSCFYSAHVGPSQSEES